MGALQTELEITKEIFEYIRIHFPETNRECMLEMACRIRKNEIANTYWDRLDDRLAEIYQALDQLANMPSSIDNFTDMYNNKRK